jgi:hypothetical protein
MLQLYTILFIYLDLSQQVCLIQVRCSFLYEICMNMTILY